MVGRQANGVIVAVALQIDAMADAPARIEEIQLVVQIAHPTATPGW